MDMKHCPRCDLDLPLTDFGKRSREKDGLNPQCRACVSKVRRAWCASEAGKASIRRTSQRTYAKKSTEIKAAVVEYKRGSRARNQAYIKNLKESTPCSDCEKFYPSVVMDFDHLGDKWRNVGSLINYSLTTIKAEIEKCEIVCANCHRIRTWDRTQSEEIASEI